MRVYVTPHAVARYIERVEPCSQDDARKFLMSPIIQAAADFGASSVRLATGQNVVIDRHTVVTVKSAKSKRGKMGKRGGGKTKGRVGGNEAHPGPVSQPHERRRADGREHDTGTIRPYRPCPADFRAVFVTLGQSKEIEDHYRTNWRVIRRWIEECGGDELRAARRAVSGGTERKALRAESRRSRYVLGMTLKARNA